MSASKRKPAVVTRTYRLEPDDCARALTELLLKMPVRAEGSPILATLDDAIGESKHGSHAAKNQPK
jgi:hypothetical protein